MSKLQMAKIAISRTAGRTGLLLSKYSPEILIGVGVVGLVGSTVIACKATLKVDEVLDKANETKKKIHETKEGIDNGEIKSNVEYSDKAYNKDLLLVRVQTGVEIVKLYAPAAILGIASVGAILGAHNIMRKRNLALVAAYKAVEKSYSSYRKRVIEEFGEEKDREFKYGIKNKIIDKETIDENGNATYSEQIVKTIDPNGLSQYARVYDNTCKEWSPSSEYNLTFLKCQQNYANDLLKSRGHIFLNEVYDMLGIPRTKEGAVVGWVKDVGDDFVDFGIFDIAVPGYANDSDNDTISEKRRDFINGYRNCVLLDFNVAGVIYDLI